MTLKFPKLTQWQYEVFELIKDSYHKGYIITCKARRQLGKTILAAISLIYYATQYPGTINHIVEPSNSNNRNVYKQIKKWLKDTGIVEKFNDQLNEIIFKNGSEIRFLSAESRDNLRGQTTTGLLVLDEMAFLNDDTIQLVMPYVDAHNSSMLCISTPMFEEGQFYRFFSNPDNVISFSFDWADPKYDISDFISNEKLEYYRKTMTEFKFKTEMLGQFVGSGGFVFRNIISCIRKDNSNVGKPEYGGIDFGSGTGNDYTVLSLFDINKNLISLTYFNDIEPTEQVDILAKIINDNPTLKSVKVEQQSIGEVYISLLKKKVKRPSIIKRFNTTNETKKKAVEEFAKALVNNEVTLPDDDLMYKQLMHFIVKKLKSGNYTYENDNPNVHDDIVMSIIIAYSHFYEQTDYKNKIRI